MPILPGGKFISKLSAQSRIEGHLSAADTYKRLGADRGTPQSIIDRLVSCELASAKMYQEALEASQ